MRSTVNASSATDYVLVGNRRYKKDHLVTVTDIEALVEAKRVEHGCLPWSAMKMQEKEEEEEEELLQRLEEEGLA